LVSQNTIYGNKEMSMINTQQLSALINANAVKTVEVHGINGGFTIIVDNNLLEAKRGHTRIFRKLQTAATFLKQNGIGEFKVNVSTWQPDQTAI
jgi:hypothetical protein